MFSGILPEPIYAKVKGSQSRLSSPGGGTRGGKGLKASEIPSQYATPKTRAMIVTKNKTFEAYKHKHSIYEGIQKASKTYQSAKQSGYVTFRRVSSNSDKNSWIHKGFQARRLAEKAMSQMNVPFEVDRLTDNYLASLGF